jgi:hypothetical protein
MKMRSKFANKIMSVCEMIIANQLKQSDLFSISDDIATNWSDYSFSEKQMDEFKLFEEIFSDLNEILVHAPRLGKEEQSAYDLRAWEKSRDLVHLFYIMEVLKYDVTLNDYRSLLKKILSAKSVWTREDVKTILNKEIKS